MVTNKQLVECMSILIAKVDRINERTKILTIKDRERKKEIKALEKKLKDKLEIYIKNGAKK